MTNAAEREETKETHELWVSLYREGTDGIRATAFTTREDADTFSRAMRDHGLIRTACKPIQITEGEGLS